MRIVTIAAFGAGFVIGARAGRDRYDQIMELARRAGDGLESTPVRDRLETYASRLEEYAWRNGHDAPHRPVSTT